MPELQLKVVRADLTWDAASLSHVTGTLAVLQVFCQSNGSSALKALFTSRNTGIGRKGRWLTAEDLEAYLYALSQPGALTGALNYYRNVFSSLPLSHKHVRSPVLLLWGERDAFLEQEMAEACRLYIRNHFRLNIISGASHWLQQDQPDIVNTLIWTFLKEGEGRKSYRN
uniref:Epoxide hydrolase 4 n=1 Tax=Xiphophorus couchianus TaxID=32473 RepID=A0A3B5LDA1_9TELE